MGLFRRSQRRTSQDPRQQAHRIADSAGLECSSCGAALGFDAEDEPDGEGPGLHLCGECNRQRNFDAELEMAWFREHE